MPYEVRKSGDGFKVFKKGTKKSFSKEPMDKKSAEKQMAALYANTDDIQESFVRRIDEALGIGGVTLGATQGAELGPSKGSANEDTPSAKKKRKKKRDRKKAAKIEDEVLEAG